MSPKTPSRGYTASSQALGQEQAHHQSKQRITECPIAYYKYTPSNHTPVMDLFSSLSLKYFGHRVTDGEWYARRFTGNSSLMQNPRLMLKPILSRCKPQPVIEKRALSQQTNLQQLADDTYCVYTGRASVRAVTLRASVGHHSRGHPSKRHRPHRSASTNAAWWQIGSNSKHGSELCLKCSETSAADFFLNCQTVLELVSKIRVLEWNRV